MNIAGSLTADSSVIPQPPTMIYSIDLLESSLYTLLVSNEETILQKWRKKSNFETLGTYHHTEKFNSENLFFGNFLVIHGNFQ